MRLHRGEQAQAKRLAQSSVSGPQTAERIARTLNAQNEAATDRGLIRRFNGGEEVAFNEIVARYRDRIQALAGRFLRNHADAEEITQDTFVRAHRGLARFRGDASLATWLHRIAVNLARNRYWYFFRRRRHLTLSLDCPLSSETSGTFSDLVATGEPSPARRAATDEFTAIVAVCMRQLDAGHRDILTLRNDLHRSYGEIARALGINEGTVKSRIARARQKLRQKMSDTCPEFANATCARDWLETARSNSADLLVAV
jgi:RNA polymerase sigma-70 factor, ECF subfamily